MQLPLALPSPLTQRFESYLYPPQGAIEHLSTLARGQARDCIFLVGPPSSGKTHLAIATCTLAQQQGRLAAYIPLQATLGRLGEALHGLDHYNLIVLDGLDALVGVESDEFDLFAFHNRVRSWHIPVLYTGVHAPAHLALHLPDLRSRLGQCTQIFLNELSDEGRAAVLLARAQQRGLHLESTAIDWLLAHSVRDLSVLLEMLDHLDRASLAAKRRITLPFLRSIYTKHYAKQADAKKPL